MQNQSSHTIVMLIEFAGELVVNGSSKGKGRGKTIIEVPPGGNVIVKPVPGQSINQPVLGVSHFAAVGKVTVNPPAVTVNPPAVTVTPTPVEFPEELTVKNNCENPLFIRRVTPDISDCVEE